MKNYESNFIKILKILAILSLVLFVISFAIALIFGFPVTQVLRVVFGTIYVLFVPGFIWSYVFFRHFNNTLTGVTPDVTLSIGTDIRKDVNGVPTRFARDPQLRHEARARRAKTGDKPESPLDLIERITLSIALSMALGPLLIFFLNKVGVKINFLNSFLEILLLIIAGFIIIFIQESKNIIRNSPARL